jgi:hypothetical protein
MAIYAASPSRRVAESAELQQLYALDLPQSAV